MSDIDSEMREKVESILDSIPIRGNMVNPSFKRAIDQLMSLFTEGMESRQINWLNAAFMANEISEEYYDKCVVDLLKEPKKK